MTRLRYAVDAFLLGATLATFATPGGVLIIQSLTQGASS